MNKGIIYFSAPWCEPCKILGPIIDQIGKEYGIPLKKVNTQYNASDTEHYNVKSVPTLIISDRDGNEIKRIQGGGMSKEDVIMTSDKRVDNDEYRGKINIPKRWIMDIEIVRSA